MARRWEAAALASIRRCLTLGMISRPGKNRSAELPPPFAGGRHPKLQGRATATAVGIASTPNRQTSNQLNISDITNSLRQGIVY